MVTYTCNPRYFGDGSRRIVVRGLPKTKKHSETLYQNLLSMVVHARVPASQEVKVRGLWSEAIWDKIVRPYLKYKSKKTGSMAQEDEYLPSKG
jgi:hypothetical protein